ncbi:hypothetical protein EMCRGX_G018204 [Ephydatia muelleri]
MCSYVRGYVCVVTLLAAVASSHYHPTFKDLLHNGGVTARCDGMFDPGQHISWACSVRMQGRTTPNFTVPRYCSLSKLVCIAYRHAGSVSISVTPTVLSTSGDWITVTWDNKGERNTSDWVGVFTPPVNKTFATTPPSNTRSSTTNQASSSTYKAGDMCGSPATDFGFLDPGMLHQVTMDNLVPGKKYFYVFGDIFGFSQEYSFTAPPVASPNSTVRVVVYGDMGNGQVDNSLQIMTAQQPALNTTNLIYSQIDQTDLVLHIGDISYARGYASVWEEFFDQIQPIATRLPYMVCIGNHERDFPNSGAYYNGTDSNGECGVPYEKRFPMPTPAQDQPWFGFDFGSVHFVLMSTEHRYDNGSAQLQYLDDHLSTVDRSKTPWLIFAGHRPMYIDSINWVEPDGDQPVAIQLRSTVEPLLKKYQVDGAFWGHHHSYQRSCPVFDRVCTEGGTVHIVVGTGGQSLSQNLE